MEQKNIYALGFFDGVHRGHQALLRACCTMAEQTGGIPSAVTFDGHPDTLISGVTPELINTPEDRLRLMKSFGIRQIRVFPFDRQMMTMPWQNFFRMLREEYGAGGLVCGDDFRCGYRGEGTAQMLARACREEKMPCTVVPEQMLDGIRISSTYIRGLLKEGKAEEAVRFLGHPHLLSGKVVTGR